MIVLRHRALDRPRRAFTLLEVLIAIALSFVLSAVMFAFLRDMLATRGRTLDHASRQRAAATLIERLESDLATALVGGAGDDAGIIGDAKGVRILTRGVMTQLASRGIGDPAALADLHVVEYRFDPTRRAVQARKHLAGEDSEFAPLGGDIAHVRFRFLVGRQWRDAFDSSAAGRLPRAVEVCVWFNPWPGEAAASSSSQLDDASAATSEAAGGNFDDDAFAAAGEMQSFRPPPPDRRRVIAIADSGEETEATNDQ